MKKLLSVLLTTCALALAAPQVTWAQDTAALEASLTEAQLAEWNALSPDVQAALLELGFGAEEFAAAVDAVASLPADQQAALVNLTAEQRETLVVAVVQVEAAVLAGDTTALTAAMAQLTAAIGALPPTARANMSVGIAEAIQTAVAALPANSPIRTVASAAVQGVGLIALNNGASATQVATIQQVATATLRDAPRPANAGSIDNEPGSPFAG